MALGLGFYGNGRLSINRKKPTGGDAKPSDLQDCKQFLRVVITDVTQMTTLPSAYKGLSFYAIAPLTQPWIFSSLLFKAIRRLCSKRYCWQSQ
jgi:hypothetical protein